MEDVASDAGPDRERDQFPAADGRSRREREDVLYLVLLLFLFVVLLVCGGLFFLGLLFLSFLLFRLFLLGRFLFIRFFLFLVGFLFLLFLLLFFGFALLDLLCEFGQFRARRNLHFR